MKDMTPQEKLAACPFCGKPVALAGNEAIGYNIVCWDHECFGANRAHWDRDATIAAWNRRASEHGEVTITTDASGRCVAVTRQDGEGRILSTIWEASEHGGGGEAVAWLAADGTGRVIGAKAKAAGERAKATGSATAIYSIPLYTTPPTPSAPGLSRATLLRIAGDYDEWGNASMAAYLREAATNAPSAPVVDDALRMPTAEWVRIVHGEPTDESPYACGYQAALNEVAKVLGTPAALSGVSAPVGVEDKEACPKCGAPTDPDWGHIGDCRPAASEDGLPELLAWWWQRLPHMEPHAAAMVEELLRSIGQTRRLAASGQGADAIKTLATGSNSVEVYGPGNHGGRADWLVAVRDNNTDSANEYEGETLEAALSAAAAPTQEKGNG